MLLGSVLSTTNSLQAHYLNTRLPRAESCKGNGGPCLLAQQSVTRHFMCGLCSSVSVACPRAYRVCFETQTPSHTNPSLQSQALPSISSLIHRRGAVLWRAVVRALKTNRTRRTHWVKNEERTRCSNRLSTQTHRAVPTVVTFHQSA